MNAVLDKVENDIKRVGWSVIGVVPTEDEPDEPLFSYSIGFTDKGHPEMIIFGLSPVRAHGLLGQAYENICAGVRYQDGDIAEDLMRPPYKASIVRVPGDGVPANVARAYYDRPIELLQIVWPDKQHHYPWEEDFSYDGDVQPVLAHRVDLIENLAPTD